MLTKARTVDPGFEEGINVKIARRHKQTKWQHNAKDNKETTQTFEKRIHPDKDFLLISGGPQAIPSKPFQIHFYVQLCIKKKVRNILKFF